MPPGSIVIHGGAAGADTIAGELAREYGLDVDEYQADWESFGRRAGPIRNARMLTFGKPDVVYAFHMNDSSGTRDMVTKAHAAKVPCHVVTAGGSES